ncbi:hypothetical protein AMQ28_04350 [Acinetobacter sp. TTH0-4]|uniref:hypothetical protein n=1 Tax=Acinetobacter sp. TTH0-4 TaxID=1646498 RepID=UPI0006AFE9BF|nr:hypothetical protein [Acinetobacter sp. TTH0-4]ALD01657.1 hypothetical protein AMQ28_04350 [Acinetobacter sp. TTH0-4]
MSRHQTFTKLVTDDKDFVGMVAYTIYKNEKLDWISQFKAQNLNREPTEDELKQFNLTTDSDLRIQQYRQMAETSVNNFVSATIVDELTQYQLTIRDDAIVKAVKKGFWQGIGENVFAGIIGAGIVTMFQLGMWLYQVKDNPEFQKQATEQIQQTAN